jgi:hypothetical protein
MGKVSSPPTSSVIATAACLDLVTAQLRPLVLLVVVIEVFGPGGVEGVITRVANLGGGQQVRDRAD